MKYNPIRLKTQVIKMATAMAVFLFMQASLFSQAVHYDATDLPLPIPLVGLGGENCAGGPTVSQVNVTASGTIGVNATLDAVNINLTDSWDGDLEINLISPAGTSWNLANQIGGAGQNYTNTIFKDGFPNINTGFAPFTGTFSPQAGDFATGFNGESITGLWKLSICDYVAADSGVLLNFSMDFTSRSGIPTMSDWGLLVLLLSLSIIGVVALYNTRPDWKKLRRYGYVLVFFMFSGALFMGFDYYKIMSVQNPTYERLQNLYKVSNGQTLPLSQIQGMVATNSSNMGTWTSVLQYHHDHPGAKADAMVDLENLVAGMQAKMKKK